MSVIYPASSWDKMIIASVAPFEFRVFYSTDLYKNIVGCFTEEEIAARFDADTSRSLFMKTVKAYAFIMQRLYGVQFNFDTSMLFNIPDSNTGLQRYYKLEMDLKFLNVITVGDKPDLSEDEIKELVSQPTNLKLWMKKLPPEKFEFRGFSTVNAVDVTTQEVLSQLKHDLLESESIRSPERFSEIERKLQSYFGSKYIKIGLASAPGTSNVLDRGRSIGHSFILNEDCQFNCNSLSDSIYEQMFIKRKPIVIEDLESVKTNSEIEREILKQGIKNLILIPLYYNDELVGLLEIGSSRIGDLTSYHKMRAKELRGLFATAVKRSLEEIDTKVQAVIKEECTAIHPSVEWRFVKAAVNLIDNRAVEKNAEMEEIVFENVYPLYGVSDIRNSSIHRNEAIQSDLIEHLRMAQGILRSALQHRELPFLDEMNFRVSKYMKEINDGLNSGDEVTVLDFLHNDVEKVFKHLRNDLPEVGKMIEEYHSLMDPNLQSFYNKRREYESAVAKINDTISNYLDEAEEKAQEMFPHYFEKYKTDGVEHGIYIGASLTEERNFDMMYLHNLRLWQLMTVCEIARKSYELLPNLPIELETTHLILVQHTPLAIRFRQDEKKFDVDGTYNIRYEIMKKRIDKATISGTSERLTQPNKIAIVYSQAREAAEYKKYIEYLQAKGYLKGELENLDLESMQGVSGLRALRVTVDVEGV